ncbi:MAG: segregation/condensation protein A, partial [Ruminiclostridium sp.]
MEELSFKLEVFEGPLDLLLSLIAKHKLNIYDIEISVLLEQFLLYLDKMQEADMEVAGEFL